MKKHAHWHVVVQKIGDKWMWCVYNTDSPPFIPLHPAESRMDAWLSARAVLTLALDGARR